MPYVDRGPARIWYTEQGTGFPMLTLAPGGMRSSVPLWEMAAINPLTAYAGQYRMIAMDQLSSRDGCTVPVWRSLSWRICVRPGTCWTASTRGRWMSLRWRELR